MPEGSANSLNSNHERRLSVTCRHIDKLLAEMEIAINISTSRLAFPQYASDLSPAQRRVIEDYIGRIRAQLVRVLDGQAIERPPAEIPISRSLHAHLAFVVEQLRVVEAELRRGNGRLEEMKNGRTRCGQRSGVFRYPHVAFCSRHSGRVLRRPFLVKLLGGNVTTSVVTRRPAHMIGDQLARSLSAYHALFYDWSERTLRQIQRRFDAYANSYRAQVERLVGDRASPDEQESTIRRDLEGLEGVRTEWTTAPQAGSGSIEGHHDEERNKATC